ncbi:phosphatase PAP2 family protein [Marinobacteraceae bacterium S3BR75-40.1]
MPSSKATRLFDRVDRLEYQLCQQVNSTLRFRPVHGYFALVSRLGDGWFWYAQILTLPFLGMPRGLPLALTLTATGAAGSLLYKVLKQYLVRERPFISFPAIHCGTPPLDRYSFPSGHSLHAVAFTTVLALTMPVLALGILPFTLSVMGSRIVLGLHYPTDVLAGAMIGMVLGLLSDACLLPELVTALG